MDPHQRLTALVRSVTQAVAICLLCLAFAFCSDEPTAPASTSTPETVDPGPYLGRYQLSPSARGDSLVLYRDGRVHFRSELTDREGSWTIDRIMLRIFLPEEAGLAPQPTGVFLLESFHRQGWRGLWNGEVRFLKK